AATTSTIRTVSAFGPTAPCPPTAASSFCLTPLLEATATVATTMAHSSRTRRKTRWSSTVRPSAGASRERVCDLVPLDYDPRHSGEQLFCDAGRFHSESSYRIGRWRASDSHGLAGVRVRALAGGAPALHSRLHRSGSVSYGRLACGTW